MRHALVAAMLLLALPALAGCIDLATEETPGALAGTNGGATVQPPVWPALEDATVRPGVQVLSPTGQCTSNFVFTGANDARVYLGLAAHCVEGMVIGESVDIGGVATGTLAYSSWLAMEKESTGSQVSGGACAKATDAVACADNDFALILVDKASTHLVHPAMRHFGGPTALAPSVAVSPGEKVLTYGNSGLRQQIEPASWHEGYVLDKPSAWTTTVYTATPGVPGDSGSGALTGDGKALGIVVTLALAPYAGSNGVTSLDLALQYARDHGGVDVRLATWDLLDAGVLPATGGLAPAGGLVATP